MEMSIGVDLGGTNLRVGLINQDGTIIKSLRCPTEANHPMRSINQMVDMIKEVGEGVSIKGIGIGSPGPLDPFKGIIHEPPNLPGWKRIELTKTIEEAVGLSVCLDNDANAAALAEARVGVGQGYKSIIYMTISTGIGAGIVIDGNIYQGAQGIAGEVGNMIIYPDGPKHSNLNGGALEAISSGTAIGYQGKNKLGVKNSEDVFRLVEEGHQEAQAILDEAIKGLAIGIANLAHVFNPSIFVLGGGVMHADKHILPPLRSTVKNYLYNSIREHLVIEKAGLGSNAGLIGAGLLML